MLKTSDPLRSKKHRRKCTPAATRPSTKPPVATPALLACVFDLPTLKVGIPKTLDIAIEDQPANTLTESIQHIALVHALQLAHRGSNSITNADSLYSRTLESAIDAIEHAVNGDQKLRCSIKAWANESTAFQSSDPPECIGCEDGVNFFKNRLTEHKLPSVLLEITHAVLTVKTRQKTDLDSLEACLPGYCKLLYQVLEVVNQTCMPVFTPRMLVANAFSEFFFTLELGESINDMAYANFVMNDYYDEEDFSDKYDVDESNPVEFLSAFNEEYPQLLPSNIFEAFGQSVNDSTLWATRSSHSLKSQIRESLANLLEQAELRSWCPQRKHLLDTLGMMQSIFQLTNGGARFASLCDDFYNPSEQAQQIAMQSQVKMFARMLDDACENAQSCGDTVSCMGYFALYADSSESACQELQTLNKGAQVVVTTLQLLHTIGFS